MVLSKPGAHIKEPGTTSDRGANRHDVKEGVVRAAPVWPQKRGPGHVSMVVPWSRDPVTPS